MKPLKDNLYNEILNYIYAHNFQDLKVFSKQYLHSIAFPSYSNNSKDEDYSIISIDFNDMAKINEKGMKKGDKILHDSVKSMMSAMPENSFCIRMGGDEFVFMLPNSSKEQALQSENKLHLSLKDNSKKLNNVTVTSYCVHSSEANSLSDMIEIADSAINVIKQNAKAKDLVNDWDILQNKITENFTTFFKNLRFHKFPMKVQHLKNIITKVITSSDYLMDTPFEVQETDDKTALLHEKVTMHEIKNLKSLNSLLVSQLKMPASHEQINKIDTSIYVNLLNKLVRDPITMQFNKSYLIRQLLENEHKTFNAMRFSSTFVKVSNTINTTHSSTDNQIKDLGKKAYSYLNNLIDLNKNPFSDAPSNYLIALDGGDMLLVLDKNNKIEKSTINSINEFFNKQDTTHFSHDNLLKLVSSNKFEKLNKKNVEQVLSSQSELCNKNKIPIIKNFLNDDIITDLLSVTLRDTVEFYNKIIPDKNDINAKTKFFRLVSRTVLDLYSSLDVEHDEETLSFLDKVKLKVSSILPHKKAIALPETVEHNVNSHEDFVSSVPKVNIEHKKAINNIYTKNTIVKNIDKEEEK